MTAIYVQPDRELMERWQYIGFTADSDATPEQVARAAMEELKVAIPIASKIEGWDSVVERLDHRQRQQLRMLMQLWADQTGQHVYFSYPWLRRALVQGDREALASGKEAGQFVGSTDFTARGKTDWQVGILVRRPKFITQKYHEPYGPEDGFERREDLPPVLQEKLGAESKVRVMNADD